MATLKQEALAFEDKPVKLKLFNNKFSLVDESDYERVSSVKWHLSKKGNNFYVESTYKKGCPILLHRIIMFAGKGDVIDHIDGNPLNNTKKNLRFATHGQNKMNIINYKNNTSGIRGVVWDKNRNKWMARIKFNGKMINLGRYKNKEDALKVRYTKAKELFGEFVVNINNYKEVKS